MMARLRKIARYRALTGMAGALLIMLGLGFVSASANADTMCNGQYCSTYQPPMQSHSMAAQQAPMQQDQAQAMPCANCSQRVLVVPKPAVQCAKQVAQVHYRAPCRVCGDFRVSVREDDRYLDAPCNQIKQ